jgi:hypothetical protein
MANLGPLARTLAKTGAQGQESAGQQVMVNGLASAP